VLYLFFRHYRGGRALGPQPTTVVVALGLLGLALALRIATIAFIVATFHQVVVTQAQRSSASIHEHVSFGASVPIVISGLVVALGTTVVMLLATMALRRGARWSRIALPLVTFAGVDFVGGTTLGILATIAAVGACVFLFLPATTAYFRISAP
jgi:hypothetical protein